MNIWKPLKVYVSCSICFMLASALELAVQLKPALLVVLSLICIFRNLWKPLKSICFLLNLSHAGLWSGPCSSIEISFIGRPFPQLLGFQMLKVLSIKHSTSSLYCLCFDMYDFYISSCNSKTFSSLLLLYCVSMKTKLCDDMIPKYIRKQTIYPSIIVQSNIFLDYFIVQRIVWRTIFSTNFSERTLSMCFNKKKTTQNIAMADWYFLHYMIYPKPSVESDLVEGWFTITKEKPYREGRSKRLLGCDLSFQKN